MGGGEAAASLVLHEPHLVQEPVPEPLQNQVSAPVQGLVPEPVRDTPLLQPGSAEELRMAQMFANTHPLDTRLARAELYGVENPHFTAHWALHQVSAVMSGGGGGGGRALPAG